MLRRVSVTPEEPSVDPAQAVSGLVIPGAV
uniref:Uncharacterized protein n=1 Tax=Podoviridae sp. ctXSp1 TaxID=2825256 RepID=A0A8S5PXX2_9CAUD|nr:MAG TPA: hypothetical protein [Podoviridae sp. ctXSp1]